MLVYFHYRKNQGLIASQAFNKEEHLSKFVLSEIQQQISNTKAEYGKSCPDSVNLQSYLQSLHKPNRAQLKDLLTRFDVWATPILGPSVLHDIQDKPLLKDN